MPGLTDAGIDDGTDSESGCVCSCVSGTKDSEVGADCRISDSAPIEGGMDGESWSMSRVSGGGVGGGDGSGTVPLSSPRRWSTFR